ncbi:MAG: Alanine--tRNA ligase [Gammaproteobacteria bacterium]|nr:MAG: Alanine--tRNA ligase [Gammaproteobacteria bacterium]
MLNIRSLFLDYFQKKQHAIIESSSLIPPEDKTLLFTNSGMVQFKDIFLGTKKAKNKRIVSCQKCVRAGGKHNDLENIGYTNRHHSFFEMLGNFSFGDYFKEEAIYFAWDFLTTELGLDKKRLYVSVHKDDDETAKIWLNTIKLDPQKLWYLDDADNFWQMGSTGPCGPCTEIYYDLGEKLKGLMPSQGDTGDRYVEIWNLVFTQYNKDVKGALTDLPKKCVDTGMGLERIHAVVEGKTDNFKSSLFLDLEKYLDESLDTKNINYTIKKIIMDHSRSACFLISDGVIPSSEGRGYVLRRIIRRATRFLYNAGIQEPFIYSCAEILKQTMGGTYSGLINKNKLIQETLKDEEENYLNTLSKGLDLINKLTKSKNELSGENIFKLYDTFGFPSEIIQEIAAEKKLKLDMKQFNSLMDKQKLTSRKASNFDIKDASFIDAGLSSFSGYNEYQFTSKILALYIDDKKVEKIDKADTELMVVFEKTPFYPEGGGQISDVGKASNNSSVLEVKNVQKVKNTIIHHAVLKKGTVSIRDEYELEIDAARRGKITVNHSATHLLNQALRDTLGDHVEQKGSLVTDKYLRFDFSHNKALTSDELRKIESIISFEINSNRDTQEKVMPYKDAISSGALAFFDEKYSDNVRVVNIGTKSMELCGGTHVENTTTIRLFKILNESSISTGIRRIEALTGDEAFHSYQSLHDEMKKISKVLNIKNTNILDKINLIKQSEENSMSSINDLNKQIAKLYFEKISFKKNKIKQTFCYIEDCSDISIDQIKILSDVVKANHKDSISVLLKHSKDIINCYVGVSKQCKHRYNAKQIIEELSKKFMSKGGGSPTFATSVIPNQDAKTVIDYLNKIL